MKTNILGVNFDVVTMDSATEKLIEFLKTNKNHKIVTPNPEMVMKAKENPQFMDILNKSDLVVPDGIGIVFASKLNKVKISERVGGCDLTFNLIKQVNATMYILGGKPGIAQKAKEELYKTHKNIKVVGVHDGYFNEEEEKEIVKEITALKPDILLVGLGMVRQETFIHKYDLPVKISAGVGGTIDIMAKEVKRAPDIFIKLNLEWFYRLCLQPSRFIRILKIPEFVIVFLLSKIKK